MNKSAGNEGETSACVSWTYVVGHHDGEQGLVVGVEGYIESGGLNHDEDGVEDCIKDALRSHTGHRSR